MSTPTPSVPVRTRIMRAIVDRFKSRVAGEAGARITWNTVIRAPLSRMEKKLGDCVGITTGTERVIKRDLTETRVLPVMIEFEVRTMLGESPDESLVETLSEIQAAIKQDLQFGGLCLHMYETDNNLDVEAGDDRSVGGVVAFEVTYRHMFDDPRRLVGE